MSIKEELMAEAVEAASKIFDGGVRSTPTPAEPTPPPMVMKSYEGDTLSGYMADRGMGTPKYDCPFTPYDPDVFPEEYQKFIPEIDPYRWYDTEVFSTLALGHYYNKRVMVTGPTGSGKTTGAESLAAHKRQPFIRVNCDSDVLRSEVLGDMVPSADGSGALVWKDGVLPKAVRAGALICIDDVTAAPAGFTMALIALMEGKPLRLFGKLDGGDDEVVPHPECRIVLTDNTLGLGDDADIYGTRSALDGAIRNRVELWCKQPYMPAEPEVAFLRNKTGISEVGAKHIVSVAGLVRQAFMERDLSSVMSPRQTELIAELAGYMSHRDAYTIVFSNSLSDEDRSTFESMLDIEYGHSV